MLFDAERRVAIQLVDLSRSGHQSPRDRLRTAPYRALVLATAALLVVLAVDFHQDHPVSRGLEIATVVVAAAALATLAWLMLAFVFWPFNPLGYMLVSGLGPGEVPREREARRRYIIQQWEARFAAEPVRKCEQMWRLGRVFNWGRLAIVASSCIVFTLAPAWLPVAWLLVPAVIVTLLAYLAYRAAYERALVAIAAQLGVASVPGFPPFDPGCYQEWLTKVAASQTNDVA